MCRMHTGPAGQEYHFCTSPLRWGCVAAVGLREFSPAGRRLGGEPHLCVQASSTFLAPQPFLLQDLPWYISPWTPRPPLTPPPLYVFPRQFAKFDAVSDARARRSSLPLNFENVESGTFSSAVSAFSSPSDSTSVRCRLFCVASIMVTKTNRL